MGFNGFECLSAHGLSFCCWVHLPEPIVAMPVAGDQIKANIISGIDQAVCLVDAP